jgi:hypothetical protein
MAPDVAGKLMERAVHLDRAGGVGTNGCRRMFLHMQ